MPDICYYKPNYGGRRLIGLPFLSLHGVVIGNAVMAIDNTAISSWGEWQEYDDIVVARNLSQRLQSRQTVGRLIDVDAVGESSHSET